ncbi:BatA domain-containing protein [Candidatus Woesearchaeota archaeon]|nr:BatA domain-containing protein [Candidatus Woesearchaeota archaeon]
MFHAKIPSISFENLFGLIGLSSLIYLILIYLIKPKPRTLYIPSLMFIMQFRGQSKMRSFFRTLIQNMMFLLQFLALLALGLLIAQPYMMVEKDVSSKNTVLVIDVSASMQAKEIEGMRFEKAISKAKELIGTKNTIVLAKNIPTVALQKANGRDTVDFLNALKATESTTSLGEAILLGGQMLGDEEGRVLVLSDFINTKGINPTTAKVVLQSKGQIVDFINVAESNDDKKGSNGNDKEGKSKESRLSNVGFVDLNIDETTTILFIKNFNGEQKTVKVKVGNEEKSLTIAANSIEQYAFNTIYGDKAASYVEAKIVEKDAIKDVEVTVNEPPVISKDKYDVFLFYNVDGEQVLPGSLEGIIEHVKKGSSAIIHSQKDIRKINYKGLLPVEIIGEANNSFLVIDQVTEFTKDLDFGFVRDHVKARILNNAVSIVSADNGTESLIATMGIDEGRVIYYGIPEESADFKFTPYYPIFWNNLLHSMVESVKLKDLHFDTESTIILKRPLQIEKPDGKSQTTSTLLGDFAGIYKIGKGDERKIIAANLLSAEESNINVKQEIGEGISEFKFEIVKESQKLNLELYLVIAGAIILLIELLYVKFRGDI